MGKKLLFFAHAVTLAHFVRPLRWIECLDLTLYDVYIASSPAHKHLIPKAGVTFIEVSGIDPAQFARIVGQAEPIFDGETYANHVEEDLRVIDRIKPDVVIGDFRHSLSVSCRLRKIKYINIASTYWSPEIELDFPMPEAPIVRSLGEKLASVLLAPFIPMILRINFFIMAFKVRKSLARAGLNFRDYRQVITDGDVTVYCDTPEMVPLKKKKDNEVFIGPLTWSMRTPLPTWWGALDGEKKRIFVSLGSSGDINLLPMILATLAKLDVEVIVALSGKKIDLPAYANVFVADFLPLEEIFKGLGLVICNGGSPMCSAALSGGAVPIIGIVCNNDQLLNMAHVQHRGAGLMLRYWNMTAPSLLTAVQRVLTDENFKLAAQAIQSEFEAYDVPKQLRSIIQG